MDDKTHQFRSIYAAYLNGASIVCNIVPAYVVYCVCHAHGDTKHIETGDTQRRTHGSCFVFGQVLRIGYQSAH